MSITPAKGWVQDPTNPNSVIRDTAIPISTLTSQEVPLNVQTPSPIPTPDIKNIPITTPPVPPTPTPPTGPTGSDFNRTLEDLQTKYLGKPAAETKAITEKTAGFEQSLNELNTQIKMHQANALARQEEALKSGETMRFASGTAQNVARTDAIEAMKLSALAQGMQGNIFLAEKQAKSAVETEFSQTLQDIQTARKNILDNYDTFTSAEKKRADATLLSLNEKDVFVAQNKEDKKQSYDLAIEAAKNGLTDNKLLTQIQNSSPEEASQLAAPYLAKKEKPLIKDFEVGGRLKRQVIDPMTGKVISETDFGGKEVSPTSDEKLSINQIEQFRRSYSWTPPFGFTQSQLLQYMNDNPNATPEELEAGARKVIGGTESTTESTTTPGEIITSIIETMSDEQLNSLKKKADIAGVSSMWRGKKTDVKNYLNSIKDKIQTAIDEGYIEEEIIEFLTS